jgi:hypothetical protein
MPRKTVSAPTRGSQKIEPESVKQISRSERKPRNGLVADLSSPDPLAPSPAHTSRKRRRKSATVEAGQGERSGTKNAATDAAVNAAEPAYGAVASAEGEEKFTLEQQREAWQEFAGEHYEMVEQLPLELHRNFRLLRELDDGCVGKPEHSQVPGLSRSLKT